MNIFEINKSTLSSLYNRFPNSFEGIRLNNNYLVYENDSVDISTFNINDLLSGDSIFGSCLDTLKPRDIFNIIKLHVDFLGGMDNE